VTNAHMAFKEAIARHYKVERDRAEECLGDIIKILDQEGDQIEQIINRLIRHYGPRATIHPAKVGTANGSD